MVVSLMAAKRTASLSAGLNEEAIQRSLSRPVTDSNICDVCDDIKQLLTVPRALILGFGLVLLQQTTGQPNVLYYVQSIFESAGFDRQQAMYIDIMVGTIKLVATLAVVPFVDRSGRVPLLFLGTSAMLFSLIILCVGFAVNPVIDGTADVILENAWPGIVVAALIIYVIGYQVGFGPITWVMISESFPLQVRARALSVAATLNFGVNLLVTLANAPVADIVGGQAVLFGVYTVMCVVALVFFKFCVPETKGKSLEEIDAMMRRPLLSSSAPATQELLGSKGGE